MATPLLGLYAPADGADAGTWGSSWNAQGSTYLDNYLAGLTTKTLSASNVTLSAAECRTMMIRLTGTLLANITIDAGASLWNGIRCVENLTSGSFSVTLSYTGTVVIPQGRRVLVYLDSSNGPRIIGIAGSSTADPIPGNGTTKMLFSMASPPSGWTQDTSLDDYALRLVSGTGAGTGGSTNFSTVFAQTATGSHTLTSNEIPSHQHAMVNSDQPATYDTTTLSVSNYVTQRNNANTSNNGGYWLQGSATTPTLGLSGLTGGGAGHTHTISLVVKYTDIIAATRN